MAENVKNVKVLAHVGNLTYLCSVKLKSKHLLTT